MVVALESEFVADPYAIQLAAVERVKRTRNKVAWSVWRRKMNAYASSVVQTSFSGAIGRMVAA
jgi:hypothetical protein